MKMVTNWLFPLLVMLTSVGLRADVVSVFFETVHEMLIRAIVMIRAPGTGGRQPACRAAWSAGIQRRI